MQGVEKLVYRDGANLRYYVHTDDLFRELSTIHKRTGHGGRDRMMKEVRQNFKNVGRTDVTDFVAGCESCEKKRSNVRKGIVVKPILSSRMNSRAQIDLIDMQSHPDDGHRFICVYQDHLTKFVVLKALKTKTAAEVAYHLLDVFTLFGTPCILQSDNGRVS